MFPWIAICLLILIVLLSYVLKWQRGRSISHLPTYTYLPGFGTMYKLLGGSKALHDEVIVVSEIMDETNLPFIYWAGSNPVIIIQDPEDLKLVTNAFIEKPSLYNFAKVWLGESVATTTGREWKHDVKGFAKALKRRSVKNYQDVFNTQAKKLVNKLKSGESSNNIFSELAYTTFEAICKICTGDSEIPDLIPVQEYHEAISNVLENVITRMTNILYHPEFLFQRTQTYRDLKKYTTVLHNVSKNLLERYKQNQLAEKNENRDGKATRAKYKPFLSHFVDIGLSEERIKSEIDILIFAQDPVATALLMIFIIIGARKDIQDKLYNEVNGLFGDCKRDVMNEDMEKMVYCEGVIRETLRLYPPGPMALRKIDEEFKIPSCTIPKDTICLINIWGSGRSKRLWGPDVLEFKPERWVDPDSLPPILAFSCGKRGCVGEKYAYPMLKTLIEHAVRELTFEADLTKIKIKADMVLKVYEGLETLRISKREATENTKEEEITKEIKQKKLIEMKTICLNSTIEEIDS